MGFFLTSFVAFFLLGFMAMFSLFRPLADKYMRTLDFKYYMLPFPYIFTLYAVGAVAAYFLIDLNDFIEPLSVFRAFLPLVLALAIYIFSLFFSGFFFAAFVIACIAVNVYIQPLGAGAPFENLPTWVFRLLTVLFFAVYCLYYKILNFLAQTFVLPSVLTLFGVSLLCILGAAPIYEAICAAMFIGILLAYMGINFNEMKIDLDDGACCAIAFLMSSILLFNMGEFCFPSCLIFTMLFWAELAIALWNRFVVIRAGLLEENTNYYMFAHKVSAQLLALSIVKVGAISLFLGWFQLFSVNQYSLLIISFFVILWLNNTAGQPFGKRQSLKEVNKEFVQDFKKNIQEAKDVFSQVSKKDQ